MYPWRLSQHDLLETGVHGSLQKVQCAVSGFGFQVKKRLPRLALRGFFFNLANDGLLMVPLLGKALSLEDSPMEIKE